MDAGRDERRGREVALATVRSGDYFGELAAIDARPRSASVVVIEDSRLAILPWRRPGIAEARAT